MSGDGCGQLMNRRVRILAASPDGIRLALERSPMTRYRPVSLVKALERKKKAPSLQTAHVQNVRYSGAIKKHGSPGRLVLMSNGGELGR